MALRMTVTENLIVLMKLVANKLSNSYQRTEFGCEKVYTDQNFYNMVIDKVVTENLDY